MINPPLISVVMSVYNAEKYLHDAVNSILNQTYRYFEFIIIDDNSTDHSLEILEEYEQKDERIILIKKNNNKGKRGFIENLNIGLDLAKGKYIARMDADDISTLDRFEKQIDKLENDLELFIVGSYLEMIDENNKFISVKKAPITDVEIKALMLKNISLYHPVLMFRNSDVRYREKMYGCEDYDLYFNLMLQNKKMENIPEVLLNYRVLNSSISRNEIILVRRAFVEKTKMLFFENKKYGKDSYNTFNPEDLNKLLEPNYKNKLEDLKLGIYTAISNSKKNELKLLIQKMNKYYSNYFTLHYDVALYLPSRLLRFYKKFL